MDEWGHAILGVVMSTALLWVMVYIPVRFARWVAARNRHHPQFPASSLYWLTLLGAAASGVSHDSCGHASATDCGGQP